VSRWQSIYGRARQFDPRTLIGLAGWWDAANAGSLTLNSGEVSQWRDLSGNGRHAAQATAMNQPTYTAAARNGRNAIQFNGSSDFLRGPWQITLTAQTTFAVVAMSSANNWGRPFTQTSTVQATATGDMNADFAIAGHYIPLLRNNVSNAFGSYNAGTVRASVNFTYDAWGVWSSTHTGAQIANRLDNGTASTYSTATFNTTFHTFLIGANGGPGVNQFLGGFVGEVLVYSRALADAERNAVHRYLRAKWSTP
jgi:hypothetical protein